jgi:uncharacterized protein
VRARGADERCCVADARAGAGASGCNGSSAKAFRTRCRAPAAREGAVRAAAARGGATQPRRLHLLHRPQDGADTAPWNPDLAQARRRGRRAQPHQAMHPRSLPARAGKFERPRAPRASALRRARFALDGERIARASAPLGRMMTRSLRVVVRAYRWFVRPILPGACRFYPSCSEYAEQALERHGARRACLLIASRLCRCGPWHPGGYDPVP